MSEECGSCFFYLNSVRVCRRNPPTPIMIGVKQNIAALTSNEPLVQAYFPSMMATGWCGEYQPDAKQEINHVSGTA